MAHSRSFAGMYLLIRMFPFLLIFQIPTNQLYINNFC